MPRARVQPFFGWEYRPADVDDILALMQGRGQRPFLAQAAPQLLTTTVTADVWFPDAELALFAKLLATWKQLIGDCVSMGWARACQDVLLQQIWVRKRPEQFIAEVATEPIYAGSRVEVGGGRIGGDGSVGAWAAEYVTRWGVLLRQSYDAAGTRYDLSAYDPNRARSWGRSGVPDPLEPVAREHPIQRVALVQTDSELIAALTNWYPVPVCSDFGFAMRRDSDGFCARQGSWAHCMLFRGIVRLKGGRVAVLVQNSWGDYLGGPMTITLASGRRVIIPPGAFLIPLETAVSMCRQRDTFAVADAKGWRRRKLDFTKAAAAWA